jgi:hypothetical protein
MPFKESSPMEESIALFREYDTGVFTATELCAPYGISRETFYDWKRRREKGDEYFEDKSHAPMSCPHRTSVDLVEAVIAMRRRHPNFGPKKAYDHRHGNALSQRQYRWGNRKTKRLGGLEVHDHLKFCRELSGQFRST